MSRPLGQYMFGAPAGAAVLRGEDDWLPYTPPPSVSVDQAWAAPGQPQQMIPVGDTSAGSPFDWKGATTGIIGGLLNIFGPRPQVQQQYVPPAPTVPAWVYLVAVPAAIIGVVYFIRRRPAAVAGYRRRKSRRNRR